MACHLCSRSQTLTSLSNFPQLFHPSEHRRHRSNKLLKLSARRLGDHSVKISCSRREFIAKFTRNSSSLKELVPSIDEDEDEEEEYFGRNPLPKPPAGFIIGDDGRVSMLASPDKLTTVIVDPSNNRSLDCVIRRVFTNSHGQKCYLLYPLDIPLKILKVEKDSLKMIDDDDVEEVIPAASYALAKIHMHFVLTGFCLTARGGFCYSVDDLQHLEVEYGNNARDVLQDVVEVTSFEVGDSEYSIITPVEPLVFVAIKDKNGQLAVVEDELLDDDLILDAIDEEKEFQALVEEEKALTDALMEDN